MISSPKTDRDIGLEYYLTDTPGIGGSLRRLAEDFQVEEGYPEMTYEGGRFLIVEVEKSNWDMHHLIRDLSRALRISQRRFGWAGTKDKRALTRQRISILGVEEKDVHKVRLPGVGLTVLGSTNRSVGLGDLTGNRFTIRVRDLDVGPGEAALCLERTTAKIREQGGVPNYFGVQRFGEVRPVTHLVGRALARGDLELAVFTYLALPYPDEPPVTRTARERLWQDRDVSRALREFPPHLHYELAMLNHLRANPGDYAGSFDVLAPNLKRMFIHAYQSYIFNRILSRRLEAGMPLGLAVEGDVVCFSRDGRPDLSRLQRVGADELGAVNRLAKLGRAFVTLPLFGSQSELAGGREGRIEETVIAEEEVAREDFVIPENRELGSTGARRTAILRVNPGHHLEEDGSAVLEFVLPPGSYATVVMREYMKSGSLREGKNEKKCEGKERR
ncbi:MAG: tRNA pseudouridine(13) synthase TruD [Methanosarcinales archaeon]|nr:tRNA pseudouridine(13) synthase TruD [Methanosarcinales archaeon]